MCVFFCGRGSGLGLESFYLVFVISIFSIVKFFPNYKLYTAQIENNYMEGPGTIR